MNPLKSLIEGLTNDIQLFTQELKQTEDITKFDMVAALRKKYGNTKIGYQTF